jgi:hypothetical protein
MASLRRTSAAYRGEPRELLVAGLQRSYAQGRLTTLELERRIAGVLAARSGAELALSAGLAPAAPCARGMLARLVRRVQSFALRAHSLFVLVLVGGTAGLWALLGAHGAWPALLIVPACAFYALHLYASRRVSRALERRHWDL